jgi:hypothetical protein
MINQRNRCTRRILATACSVGSQIDYQFYSQGFSVVPDSSASEFSSNDIDPITPRCLDSGGIQIPCTAPTLNTLTCTNAVSRVEYDIVYRKEGTKLVLASFLPIITLETVVFGSSNGLQTITQNFGALFRNVTIFKHRKQIQG